MASLLPTTSFTFRSTYRAALTPIGITHRADLNQRFYAYHIDLIVTRSMESPINLVTGFSTFHRHEEPSLYHMVISCHLQLDTFMKSCTAMLVFRELSSDEVR